MEEKILKDILSSNDRAARSLREELTRNNITAINLMSSPGSGKTSLLEKTLSLITPDIKPAVIQGDITTSLDVDRLSSFKVPSIAINTAPSGGECHLEAGWINDAYDRLDSPDINILFIENIGNLVCPAEFDTGAHKNVVLISVPEGEDKPLKYPLAFKKADLMIVNKSDLIEVLDFNLNSLIENAMKINPSLKHMVLSARTGSGFDSWINWIKEGMEDD